MRWKRQRVANEETKEQYQAVETQVEEIDAAIEKSKNQLNETTLLKQQLEGQINVLKSRSIQPGSMKNIMRIAAVRSSRSGMPRRSRKPDCKGQRSDPRTAGADIQSGYGCKRAADPGAVTDCRRDDGNRAEQEEICGF